VHQGGEDPGAAGAERVAQCDGSTVDVHPLRIEAELADAGDRLDREGLVQLDQVEVRQGEAGAAQRLSGGRNRPQTHAAGIHSGHCRGDHSRHRAELEALQRIAAHHR
jgi:hypothetical protein